MANKKINQLGVRSPLSLSDLMLVGDPSTGYSYKTTIGDLSTFFETNIALNDLNDVTISSPVNGNLLAYNGTQWVNRTLGAFLGGSVSQYVRGDGTLGDFSGGGGGGGASISYYLNGSVNQGTISGVTYLEMNKNPVIGVGTDFTRNTNGYIASFLTDANDPALLKIPAGNWNLEFYFHASSGGGTPTFYVELYKYDGSTFTLIASNSTTPEAITGGTVIDAYFTALAVPETVLTLTDRLAIRVYTTTVGRTITLHTENSHLCQVITTFTTGLTALNNLTAQVQFFGTGTTGTDFNISSTTATHTFNIPTASATNRGALSSSDWTSFNSKQNAITLTTTGSSGAATFVSNTLNIPTYTLAGLGGVPTTRTLTINGTSFDLSADRSWTISTGPTGSGTTNYVTKWTSSSALGNSLIFDNGTNVGIGTATPTNGKFQIDAGTDVPVVALTTNSDVARYFSSVTYAGFRVIAPINTGVPYIGLNTSSSIGTYDVGNQKAFFAYWSDNSGYASLGYGSTSHAIVYRVNNGNVIIGGGTTDAGYKLDVNGTTRISGTELRLDNATTGVINLYSATPEIRFASADPTNYRFYRSGTGMILNSAGSIIQQIGGNSAYQIDATNGHLLRSAIAGGAALARLTTGGNFMIGTTIDAGQRFQVNGTTRLTGDVTIVTTTNARQITFENSGLRAGVNISQPNNTLTFNNGAGFELNSHNVTFFTSANTYFKGFQAAATFSYVNTSNVSCWSTLPDASVPYAWGRKLCLTGGTTITVPNASAVLDIQSTTMGFLPPRMTGAQAELIGTPAAGLMVYSTDGSGATITSLGWWGYNGTTWVKLN